METTTNWEEGNLNLLRSAFKVLVQKMGCDSLNTEEEHSVIHKTPFWLTKLSNRLAWAGTIFYFIYLSIFLGDQHAVFNTVTKSVADQPYNDGEVPTRYEMIYFLEKVPKSTY